MQVLKDLKKNLYVYIYTNDHTPGHVHIFYGRKNDTNRYEVKINIGDQDSPPVIVKANPKMSNDDIRAAWELVADNQENLLEKWNQIHGIQKLEKSSERGGTKRSNRKG